MQQTLNIERRSELGPVFQMWPLIPLRVHAEESVDFAPVLCIV